MAKKLKQKLSSIAKNNLLMLSKIARYTPEYFILMILEGVIQGAISSAYSVFTFNLLNAVDEGSDFLYAAKIIGLMALFFVIAYAYNSWYRHYKMQIMRKKLHLSMQDELFRKSLSLDLASFDDSEFYNDFVWAMNECENRAIEILSDTGALISRIISSFTLLGLVLSVDKFITVLILISSLVRIVGSNLANRFILEHRKELTPLNRKKGYINRVHHMPDYAKELRTNKAGEILLGQYDENANELIAVEKKYGIKYFWVWGLCIEVVANLTFFATMIRMTLLVGEGMAIGGFAASAGVVWRINWMLSNLVRGIAKYPQHSLFIEKYLGFMNAEPTVTGEVDDIPDFESLEFRNVSFSYEFSAHPKYKFHDGDYEPPKNESGKKVLNNVSLKISKGDKIAIVGYNGAGKTTLIKLIMRFYDPTEGEILYNGVNIKNFDPVSYRKKIGTVFQDFKIFATSIAENVINGEYTDADEEAVLKALDSADFTDKLKTFEKGIHTHLTREFDDTGTNLSGGEAQKIAISRAFAGDRSIIIMDEPSSALDPMAEYNLNQSILQRTRSNTVIFISHRLSTTRIADKIYMFDSGCLIEEGSHGVLLAKKGKYAEMFKLQSEKYKEAEAID